MKEQPMLPRDADRSTNPTTPPEGEERVAVDGFQQVLEMLKIADPAFRESLLQRLALRDQQLARDLRRDLRSL